MAYKEMDHTIKCSEKINEIYETERLALIVSGTGSGKTFISLRTIYLRDPRAKVITLMPKSKALQNGWEESTVDFNNVMNSDIQLSQYWYHQIKHEKGVELISQDIEQAIRENRKIYLVIDEIHEIKLATSGVMSEISKNIILLASYTGIDKILGCSAVIAPNSYLDLAIYFIIAGYYENVTQFIEEQIMFFDDRHCPMVKNPYTKVPERIYFRNPDKLDAILNKLCVTVDTSHLMPPVQRTHYTFELDNKIKYVDQNFFELFEDPTQRTRAEYVKKINQLKSKRAFKNNPSYQKAIRKIITSDPNRMNLLGYVIYESIYKQTNPRPLLIFYQYNDEKDAIVEFINNNEKTFKNLEIKYVNGKKKQIEQPESPYTCILIQYKAGAAALEFPETNSLFFMPTYRYDLYIQAIGRNVRANLTEKVYQWEFEALINNKATQDTQVWDTLSKKEDFTEALGKNYKKL